MMVHSGASASVPTVRPSGPAAQPLSYSVKGAADVIGVSKTTIWRLIASQELATFKLGCRTLIRADELRSFIDQKSQAA